jgi:hypothetical protein
VHFRFNAWGEKYTPYDRDATIGARVAEHLGLPVTEVPLVLEGGSIAFDGAGTLVTIRVGEMPDLTPGVLRAEMESVLRAGLGVERFVWLTDGIAEDTETDGHVDNVVAFVAPGRAVLQGCDDPANPNHAIAADNRGRLEAAGIAVVEVPTLSYVDIGGDPVPVPSVTWYVANGVVVVPVTGAATALMLQLVGARTGPRSWPSTLVLVTVAAACTASPSRCRCRDDPAHRLRAPRLPAPRRHAGRRCVGLTRTLARPRRRSTTARRERGEGALLVCLQELTLLPYFAITPDGPASVGVEPEALPGGRTHEFAARLAAEHGVHVHASLYERADDGGLGYNTAIVVAPDGALVARTRKMHLPVTAGYYEDKYFRVGDTGYPVSEVAGA